MWKLALALTAILLCGGALPPPTGPEQPSNIVFTPLVEPGSPVWDLTSDSIGGTFDNNIGYGSQTTISTWTSQPTSLGTSAAGTFGASPLLEMNAVTTVGKHYAAVFNYSSATMTMTGSATTLASVHQGSFDIVMFIRPNSAWALPIICSTNSAAEKGFCITTDLNRHVRVQISNGTTYVVDYTTTFTVTEGTWIPLEVRGNGATLSVSKDMVNYETQAFTGAVGAGSATRDAHIGVFEPPVGAISLDAAFLRITAWSSPLSSTQAAQELDFLTRTYGMQVDPVICALGDSITVGTLAGQMTWPQELEMIGVKQRAVGNYGVTGTPVSEFVIRYNTIIKPNGNCKVVTFLGSVNDLQVDVTAATLLSEAQPVWDDIISQGIKLVLIGVTPWAGAATSTSGRQTQTSAWNADQLTYCNAHSSSCAYVDTVPILGNGASPPALAAQYANADQIHPNGAGDAALAPFVDAAVAGLGF